jgi:acetyl esterase
VSSEASSGYKVPAAEPLDSQIQTLVDNLPNGLALPVGDDAVKAREQFRRITVGLREQLPAGDLAETRDITVPGAVGDQRGRVYVPHGEKPMGTFLFFHGGGFIVGDIESYELQARTFAERTGMQVVSVEYRLAPEDPFPAAADDAVSIAKWVLARIDDFGGDAARVIVGGDSAGGNLAAVVAQDINGFAGQVLIYPAADFSKRYPSLDEHGEGPVLTKRAAEVFHTAYLGDADPSDPRLSPLLGADFGNQPPAVVVTCEYDILRDSGLAYAARLEEFGVPVTRLHYPSLMHGLTGFFPLSEACDRALDEICAAAVALTAS